jgi:putative ABC transport system permease protein
MFSDLRHLGRMLRRSPASAIATVATLALTLGAGASIFAVVDAVLLTPPPFVDPDALVMLGEIPIDGLGEEPRAIRYSAFDQWRERAEALATIEAFDPVNLTLTGLGPAERMSTTDVTPGFLPVLGVAPALGRAFVPGDTGLPVVIISHAFWRSRLATDPNVIGREVVLGGRAHTIVGVLPASFFFAFNPGDAWRPLGLTPAQAARTGERVRLIARLGSGVSPTNLVTALDDVGRASTPPTHAVVTGVASAIAGDAPRTLGLLAGAAVLALVIAFTNLAGLLVVRSIARWRELAVRSALGARRSEIARQLLLEAGALVALGTAGGVLLAWWMTPTVGRLALEQFGGIANRDVVVSWRVIGMVSLLAAGCAGLCGLLPALVAARRNVVDLLRRGATPPPRELLTRRLFVTGEVALAFVLLVSMTLLGQSLLGILDVKPGLDADDVITMRVSLPAANYPSDEQVASFYSALHGALEGRLGTRAISIVDEIPLTGDEGRRLVGLRPGEAGAEAVVRVAGTGYFDVMRVPLIAGRPFDRRDNSSAPPRVVVSESLAERLFGSDFPIGRQIRLAAPEQTAEVIGIVGDVKLRALDEATLPTVYLSAWQAPSRSSHVVSRSARPDAEIIAIVREEVARLDGDLPVYAVRSMQEVVEVSPGVPAKRVLTATFMGFALLAVVLGAIGLFGVVTHDVASRRPELALRIALGAAPARILSATMGQGALMVGIGLVAGGVLSIFAVRLLTGVISPAADLDALTVGVPAVALIVVGAGAVLPAARRAARTDPITALRSE